uniref:Uncharacterized protein n=1 Tax=Acrobeloides nanus TaxID=290746 RepID=A0A914CPN8_9BILA
MIQGGSGPSSIQQANQQLANSLDKQFVEAHRRVERCLLMLKSLRSQVLSTHSAINEGFNETDFEDFKNRIKRDSQLISDAYDNLENEAKQLPATTPLSNPVDLLNRFMLDGHVDLTMYKTYLKSIEGANWVIEKDDKGQTPNLALYLLEFLRGFSRRRAHGFQEKQLPYTISSVEKNPQREFETSLQELVGSKNSPYARRCQVKFLERSTLNCAIELKIMQPAGNHVYVALKMMFLINNGTFDYVQFIAPHEEWSYLDSAKHQLDLSAESRYHLYRRLTVYGNLYLMSSVAIYMSAADPKNTIGNKDLERLHATNHLY